MSSFFDSFRLRRPREDEHPSPEPASTGEDTAASPAPQSWAAERGEERGERGGAGERESGGAGESSQHHERGASPQDWGAGRAERSTLHPPRSTTDGGAEPGAPGETRRFENENENDDEDDSQRRTPNAERRTPNAEGWLRAHGERLDRAVAALESARLEAEETLTRVRSEAARRGLAETVWASAPLDLRLQFIRGVLEDSHPLQPALKEASGLLDLCRKGSELEGWVSAYPTLFADSYMLLIAKDGSEPGSPAEQLAALTLQKVRAALDQALSVMGAEWIVPAPGAAVGEDAAVAGEENVPGIPEGRITRCERLGLRRRGAVLLPARVHRQSAVRPVVEGKGVHHGDTETRSRSASMSNVQCPMSNQDEPVPSVPSRTPNAERRTPNADWPDWLRTLQRSSAGQTSAVVQEILNVLRQLAESPEPTEEALRKWMESLLPLLGPGEAGRAADLPADWFGSFRAARAELLDWLASHAGIEILSPSAGSPFDPATMEPAGERRTAHQHEADTVAKVERPGFRRHGRVLCPARVLRYTLGEAA